MNKEPLRLLILGAHPDDAEFHAGGLVAAWRRRGQVVKLVSLTNGAAGHFRVPAEPLAALRRREAAEAAAVVGAESAVWDEPDGELVASLTVRRRVIREIRTFRPNLVLTHRPNDYHPDHRAAGQLVQDASYMVTVPGVLPDVPALREDPVVAYLPDVFTRPCPLRPDVISDVTDRVETIVRMLACHRSQVFEWLPYEEGILDTVPDDPGERLRWLTDWYLRHVCPRLERFSGSLAAALGGQWPSRVRAAEVFELSEYGGRADRATLEQLFPDAVVLAS